jgi:hypothetical protein
MPMAMAIERRSFGGKKFSGALLSGRSPSPKIRLARNYRGTVLQKCHSGRNLRIIAVMKAHIAG